MGVNALTEESQKTHEESHLEEQNRDKLESPRDCCNSVNLSFPPYGPPDLIVG